VLGFFSFTEVTDPDGHRAYNEWHQLDHLPEQFSLEGIRFGQRWVCSPPCAAARVAVTPLLEPCQYITLYLMEDDTVLAPFAELAKEMRREDRFFEARRAHLSGPFEVVDRWVAPRVRVSAGVVPYRPSRGVYVVVGPPVDGAALVEQAGVAGAWRFDDDAVGRSITVAFVDGDLLGVAAELGAWCLAGHAELEWAGPLEGIDAYHWDWFARLTPS
jgi:hypothetical protein